MPIQIELTRDELNFICEALSPYAGRSKKSRITKQHKKFCDKLFTDLAYIASQDGVMIDENKYFKNFKSK